MYVTDEVKNGFYLILMTLSIGILLKLFEHVLIFNVNFLLFAHWFMSISISHMNYHYISVYQARYAASILAKYLDTASFKTSTKFYKTNFPSDMIFTKADSSSSEEQVDKLTKELNIHYKACIISLINILSTRVYFSFVVRKLEKIHKILVN